MNITRKLDIGDVIECRGTKAKIAKIISQDAFIPKKDVLLDPHIDIEFEDTNGKYRRWRSELDGGKIHYSRDIIINAIKNGVLAEFYEPQIGLFNIPFSDVTSDISNAILTLLENGFGLVCTRDEYDFYTVFCLDSSCARYRKIFKCREFLQDYLYSKGYSYMEYISMDEYAEDGELQGIIDRILEESSSFDEILDGWRVALTIDKGNFMFIEVLDAFK